MPFEIVPKSLYPLVPNAAGVPALLRSAARLTDTATLGYLGLSDSLSSLIGAEPVKWGVFDSSGAKIAPYDSVYETAYQNDSRVSDYPVEAGAFGTYNKVESAFQVMVTLTCGGDEATRANFQTALETARRSLNLYTVMTPDRTYYDVNFTGLNISRTLREGAYLISAQLSGREVREIAQAEYSAPKDIGAYDPKEQGQIQVISDPTIDASGIA